MVVKTLRFMTANTEVAGPWRGYDVLGTKSTLKDRIK